MHGQATPQLGDLEAQLDAMDRARRRLPDHVLEGVHAPPRSPGWFLDDHDPSAPQVGKAFLDACARERRAHGLRCTRGSPAGRTSTRRRSTSAPRPRRTRSCDFVVYHSGFEIPVARGPARPGRWRRRPAGRVARRGRHRAGRERVRRARLDLVPHAMRDPDQAAHVLGKLLAAVGPDRIVWGTDSIWYGSPQPQIEAFRAFEITPEYQERFGYPALTPEVKRKILGGNAAELYDVDPITTRCDFSREELDEVRARAAATTLGLRPAHAPSRGRAHPRARLGWDVAHRRPLRSASASARLASDDWPRRSAQSASSGSGPRHSQSSTAPRRRWSAGSRGRGTASAASRAVASVDASSPRRAPRRPTTGRRRGSRRGARTA